MQPNQVILSVHALKRPLLAYVRMHVALAAVIAHASFQALVTGRHEGKVCAFCACFQQEARTEGKCTASMYSRDIRSIPGADTTSEEWADFVARNTLTPCSGTHAKHPPAANPDAACRCHT
eukprot:1159324-Pelagomonas_calceolata.AAC.5